MLVLYLGLGRFYADKFLSTSSHRRVKNGRAVSEKNDQIKKFARQPLLKKQAAFQS